MKKLFQPAIFLLTILYLLLSTSTSVLAAATFSLNPATQTMAAGNTVNVNIMLDTGGQSVNGGTAVLTYDPTKLSVVDASLAQVGTQIGAGTVFGSPLSNIVDTVLGKITLDYGSSQSTFSGQGVFGTISLKALTGTSGTPVSFVLTGGTSNSAVYSGNANVLSAATNGTYVISGATSSASAATSSSLPVAGNVENTFFLLGASLIFLSGGVVLFRFSR